MLVISAFIEQIGGPVVAILLCLSVVATSFILLKGVQIVLQRSAKNATPAKLLAYLQQGEVTQIALLSQGQRNPRSQIISRAVELFKSSNLDTSSI